MATRGSREGASISATTTHRITAQKTSKRLLVAGALGALAAVAFSLVCHFRKMNEPVYQGQTLSQWLRVYHSSFHQGGRVPVDAVMIAESEKAFRAMGTNCIPILIRWLSKDYPARLEILHRNDLSNAQQVFGILGDEARPAAPALVKLTKSMHEDVRLAALICLVDTDPDESILIPVLVRLVHDASPTIRFNAAEHIVELDAEAARKAGVERLYPHLFRELNNNHAP